MRKIIYILAPMDDVTDVVFRQIIAEASPPDLFFTEFVNVDGLQSKGRPKLIHKLQKRSQEVNSIAQIWGKNPDNFYKTASELIQMGFAGVDINMGCPVKTVIKSGCCSALINNRDLAVEIIQATKAGTSGKVPVSVKTRTGFNEVDFSWHELLLRQEIDMLTVHGRTTKQLSKVPANWQDINKVRILRDKIAPKTLIIGNGDVVSRQQGDILAKKYHLDGIMIGRGIFTDPFVFSKKSNWHNISQKDKLNMFIKHLDLFKKYYHNGPKNWESLKRMSKTYINNVNDATKIRDKIVRSKNIEEMKKHIEDYIKTL